MLRSERAFEVGKPAAHIRNFLFYSFEADKEFFNRFVPSVGLSHISYFGVIYEGFDGLHYRKDYNASYRDIRQLREIRHKLLSYLKLPPFINSHNGICYEVE